MLRRFAPVFICWLSAVFSEPLLAEGARVVLEVSPPHQTFIDGKVGGLATDVVDALMQKAGLTPQYEIYPWARAYRIAASTPNVIIFNMARTSEREPLFEWIGPVASHRFGFLKLSRRADIQVAQLADIHRYLVGVQRDDFAAEWLQNDVRQPPAMLQLQADVTETWHLFVKGKLDLMIDDPNALTDVLRQYHLKRSDLEFVFFPAALELKTWLALKKGSDPKLIQRLKQAHQQVINSDAYRRVMQFPIDPAPGGQ